jgi:subtilisin family serine protease
MAEYVKPSDLNSAALLRARVHPALTGLDGRGVVICFIDYGFDLFHPALRTASGETRFAALIDQNGGHVLQRARINQLLRASDRDGNRDTLDSLYDPHANYFGRQAPQVGAHATWVASIAAGSRMAAFTGIAPNATLIGIQLDLPDTAWREEDASGTPTWLEVVSQGAEALSAWNGWRSYEDSNAIVSALQAGFEFARSLRPDGIVFNLSIGSWAGAHDAASCVNRAVADIHAACRPPGAPMAAIVTGTGNAGADQGHFCGDITSVAPLVFGWSFSSVPATQSKLEIWTDCPGPLSVEIKPASGDAAAMCRLDSATRGTQPVTMPDGQLVGVAESRGRVRGALQSFRFLLHPGLSAALRRNSRGCAFDLSVRSLDAQYGGRVHAWIERDCSGAEPATLTRPSPSGRDNRAPDHGHSSLTSLACAPGIISVAGLDNAAADDVVIAMSGCGPRPWQDAACAGPSPPPALPSPVLAAPASRLFGARSKTTGFMRGSGTSAAAAVVSGAAALVMQAASIAGRSLDDVRLLDALLGVDGDRWRREKWRPDLGFGALRLDPSLVLPLEQSAPQKTAPRTEDAADERTVSPPV